MTTNRLRVESNERIDLDDFLFGVDSGQSDLAQHPYANFFTDPSGQRAWVVSGFAISSPAATQVQVDRGVAILSRRENGQISHGVVTALGDPQQIIDISTFSPGTYKAYVKFQFVDGENASRVFWDASGSGSEFAQDIPTRRTANWSFRLETTSPGTEWLELGDVQINAGPVVGTITDRRPFYFEGQVDNSYDQDWGDTADRNADRQQYGIRDFRTFTDAMRQCIEDLKGRGLRRWWELGIGGMNVGFDTDPTEDRIAVGNTQTFLQGVSLTPRLQVGWANSYFEVDTGGGTYELQVTSNFGLFDSATNRYLLFDSGNDRIRYDTATNVFQFQVSGVPAALIATAGVHVNGGLVVGNASDTPVNDTIIADGDVRIDGGLAVGNNTSNVDSGSGNFTDGLAVGYTNTSPTDNTVSVGDVNFSLWLTVASDPRITYDTNDYMEYDRSGNQWEWTVAATLRYLMTASAFRPATDYGASLGAASIRWDDFHCWSSRVSSGDTDPVVDRFERVASNSITVCGKISSGGALLGATHWNVAGVSRIGAGQYRITVSENIGANSFVLSTPEAPGALYCTSGWSSLNSWIDVQMFNSTGTLTDNNFGFAAHG